MYWSRLLWLEYEAGNFRVKIRVMITIESTTARVT